MDAFVSKFGSYPGNADFNPFGIVTDRRGIVHVLVEGAAGNDLEDFTADGSFLGQWFVHATDGGPQLELGGPAIDPSGDEYLTVYRHGVAGLPQPALSYVQKFVYSTIAVQGRTWSAVKDRYRR